jgi:hypothetical protein
MKIGKLHFHIRFERPYFIRPEMGGWQLGIGFLTISKMP